jgi:hypothetical protein
MQDVAIPDCRRIVLDPAMQQAMALERVAVRTPWNSMPPSELP